MEKLQMLAAVIVVLCAVFISQGESLQCYQCNSAYNDSCNDPFDRKKQGDLLKDCLPSEVYCRKIDQLVVGSYRTIRECGTTESEMRCINRVGSKTVKMNYCSCQGASCNSANRIPSLGLMLQGIASIILAYFLSSWVKL